MSSTRKSGRWVPVKDSYGRSESFGTLTYEMDFDTLQRRMDEIRRVYGEQYEKFLLKRERVDVDWEELIVYGWSVTN